MNDLNVPDNVRSTGSEPGYDKWNDLQLEVPA